MNLEFHGAVRTVTGSQHLLTIGDRRILLDCGLYQGSRKRAFERNRELPFDPASIDAMVLSHAHMDHAGNIPNLVKNGFDGDIVCTYATRDLCTIMLRDSAKIQSYDVEYINRKRAKHDLPPIGPIYTEAEAIASLRQFVGIGYDRRYRLLDGIDVTLIDAGHILGSAIVILDVDDGGERKRVVFSGDIGRPDRPILRDPRTVDRADVLIIESTYGNRTHEEGDAVSARLCEIVNDTVARGGNVIIPAFAVGRTQEIVYRLHRLVDEGRISDELRVFCDSPLAIDATGIYRLHPEAYDEDLERFMDGDDRHDDPFGFDMMRYTRTTEQSKALNHLREPAVIISASGMCEAGRVLHHLKNNVEDEASTILIVGWQAPHTLGRRLVEKSKKLSILGGKYALRARVETINGFSAHADRPELLAWAGALEAPPSATFIVHGEEDASESFAEALERELDFPRVIVPELGERYTA